MLWGGRRERKHRAQCEDRRCPPPPSAQRRWWRLNQRGSDAVLFRSPVVHLHSLCISGAFVGNYRPARLTVVPGNIMEVILRVIEKHLQGSVASVTANVVS